MATLTEGVRNTGFVMSEANGQRSRENVTLRGGFTGAGLIKAGKVLGALTSGGKYVESPASGADGSQTAIAVLLYDADVSDGDVVVAVIRRDAEVNGNLLSYDDSVDTDNEIAAKATQLAAVGIIVRNEFAAA
jgi:hypothetical protein